MTKYVRFEVDDDYGSIIIYRNLDKTDLGELKPIQNVWYYDGIDAEDWVNQDELTEILAKLKELNGNKP